jgi:hypothetical protein
LDGFLTLFHVVDIVVVVVVVLIEKRAILAYGEAFFGAQQGQQWKM